MSNMLFLVFPTLAAAALAFAFAPLVSKLAVIVGAVDMPGERKIHHRPIPRLGGVAVVSAVAVVWTAMWWFDGFPWNLPRELAMGVGIGVLPVLLVSVIDDIRTLPAVPKFLAHILGACVAVACGVSFGADVHLFGGSIPLGWVAAPLSVLWIVGVTNAFNIIDGLDGLSAGLALISATSMAGVFLLVGYPGMACAALVLAGALAGFLPYNVHPARLFLGDTGATAIGFCLAAFALRGGSTLTSGFAALLPVFILGLPIADTCIAMARRTLSRLENRDAGMFVPDRKHIHHRLLDLGIGHARAVLILYGAGVVLAAAAFMSMFLQAREASLFVIALLLAGFVGINRLKYDEFAIIKRGTVLRMYEAPVVNRSMFVVFLDLAIAVVAAFAAVGLKADTWNLSAMSRPFVDLSATVVPLTVIVFWKSGLYRGSWRVAAVPDLVRVCAATVAVTLLALVGHAIWSPAGQSYSVFLIYGLASTVLVTASRASYVVLLNSQRRASNQGTPVLLYGAGGGGAAGVRELFEHPETGLRPIGFIDDDPGMLGRIVSGLPVLGSEANLASIIHAEGVQAVLVSSSRIRADRAERARAVCEQNGVNMFRLDIRFEPLHDGAKLPDRAPAPAVPQPALVAAPARSSAVDSVPAFAIEDLAVIGTQPCLSCGSRNVHRSKVRNLYERVKKLHSPARLFRCHDCEWRGWLLPLQYSAILKAETNEAIGDLASLDRALEKPTPATSGLRMPAGDIA